MGAIKILPSEVYNKIAAGEVVERPSSIVKELVENCIDAGASSVEIATMAGGVEQITITDNGCGIAEDDINIAFLNHTTSKLAFADDLFSVKTLGFRGEALSSISAVSHISMTSRTPFDDVGVQVEVDNGQITSKKYVSANVGTKITVTDLFYNIPARKKFLKADSREAGDITQFVGKLILTNPFLEVKYISNGKTIYDFKGTGLEEAIHCVYGSQCLENCIPINSVYNEIVVKGYIGNINYTKSNSTHQTLAINGRYVKCDVVQAAARRAFLFYLMTRSHPFFVFDIKMPLERIDVNVHPNKMELRFDDSRDLYAAVFLPVKAALKNYSERQVKSIFSTNPDFNVEYQQPEEAPRNMLVDFNEQYNYKSLEALIEQYTQPEIQQIRENNHENFKKLLEETDRLTISTDPKQVDSFPFEQYYSEAERKKLKKSQQTKEQKVEVQQSVLEQEQFDLTKIKIAGAAFSTYLILENDENLILVDQHAAHERLLFDKYMKDLDAKIVQPLMFPHVFSVNPKEAAFIEENLAEIQGAGIYIQNFGTNTFRISEVAASISDINIKAFVRGLLENVDEFKLDSKQVIFDKIARKACRAAVKAGAKLNTIEIEQIAKDILKNKVLQCPHGRPVTITIAKSELEKLFKRIV